MHKQACNAERRRPKSFHHVIPADPVGHEYHQKRPDSTGIVFIPNDFDARNGIKPVTSLQRLLTGFFDEFRQAFHGVCTDMFSPPADPMQGDIEIENIANGFFRMICLKGISSGLSINVMKTPWVVKKGIAGQFKASAHLE